MSKRLKTFLFAIFAGIAISFGGLLFILSKTYIPADWGQFVGACLFPVGLAIICYRKYNLYTGKIGIAPNLTASDVGFNVIEWLFLILLGNTVGAFAFGGLLYPVTFINNSFTDTIIATGLARQNMNLLEMFIKAIICGMLVYAAVYFFNKASSNFGKILGVFIPIAFFVSTGMQHCIANMFYMAISGCWTVPSLIALLVCILGNSFGGLLINVFNIKN